ncbi:MAG: phosphoribosylformylglycinamidine synthase subunit PurL [Thermoproteota archaeon]
MNSFYKKVDLPFPLFEISLEDLEDFELIQISQEMGIGLNLNEMKVCRDYFTKRGRKPTDVELQTIGQTWSEHCYHKTFKGIIITKDGTIDSIFKTFISSVTKELNTPWCLSVFEDNAGIVSFEERGHDVYAIAAKVETHNHPSAIEPFGGAATGVGGVIRDILGVWANPIVCTDVLCFGPLNYEYSKLPAGTKHPKYLFSGVVSGIGAYGNNMGIPTVNGGIFFDDSYVGNVVVYCGCVGILRFDKFRRRTAPGDFIVVAGGETGRDGIHGVTFASAELTEESEERSRSAVQIPNPIEEEKLKRAIIAIGDKGLASSITDLGGGGLSSAAGEMAHRAGCGLSIDLDKVPLKYPGMAPWEIYISESQERMLFSVPQHNLSELMSIFEEEDIRASVIGQFDSTGILRVRYNGYIVAELGIDFLFSPPKACWSAEWMEPDLADPEFAEPARLDEVLLNILSSPNVCSREEVIRTYDHEVKGSTVIKPLQGEKSGPNDAAVIKPLPDSMKGLVISSGMNPMYGKIDPYWMAASAIDEAVRNNVAVGGRRIALLDNFTWGSPEKPDRLGSLVRAAKGCYDVARTLGTPFISGKDSLYNEAPSGPVTPTLLITGIGIIPDVRNSVSIDLKKAGDPFYIVGMTKAELGGSEYFKLKGYLGKSVPKVNASRAKILFDAISNAIDAGCIRACHDISQGGLGVAAAEMAFSSDLGLKIDLKKVPVADVRRDDQILFSESNSRFLLEVSRERVEDFHRIMKGVTFEVIGYVVEKKTLSVRGLRGKKLFEVGTEDLERAWKKGLG